MTDAPGSGSPSLKVVSVPETIFVFISNSVLLIAKLFTTLSRALVISILDEEVLFLLGF